MYRMSLVCAKFHSLLLFILHRHKAQIGDEGKKGNEEGQKMPFSLDKSAIPERQVFKENQGGMLYEGFSHICCLENFSAWRSNRWFRI